MLMKSSIVVWGGIALLSASVASAGVLFTPATQTGGTSGSGMLSDGLLGPEMGSVDNTAYGNFWGNGSGDGVNSFMATRFSGPIEGEWDLGVVHNLDTFTARYWKVGDDGPGQFEVYLSDDGNYDVSPTVTLLTTAQPPWGTGWDGVLYFRAYEQAYDLSGYSARFIKIVAPLASQTFPDAYVGISPAGLSGWQGIAEYTMTGGPVPEPASACLLAAAGLLLLPKRRRA